MSGYIALYLGYWVTSDVSDKAKYWWVPLVFSGLFLFLPIWAQVPASEFTEASLRQMKVGGIPATLAYAKDISDNERKSVSGTLLLRTGEYIYFRPDNEEKMVIVKPEYMLLSY